MGPAPPASRPAERPVRGALVRNHEKGGSTFHQECSLTHSARSVPPWFPQGPSCRCLQFHVPTHERSIFKFPTALAGGLRLHRRTHLGYGRAGPPRSGHRLSSSASGAPAVQRLPRLCQDRLSAEDTQQRLLGHQPTLRAETVPGGKLQVSS